MNSRKIREDLGRAKTSCQRRDLTTALLLLISCIKDLSGQRFPPDFRTDFREALTAVCADPQFKTTYPQPVIYKPGGEREILAILIQVYNMIVGQKNTETFEEAAERKLKIDLALRDAKNFLARGQVGNADTSFTNAVKYYRDETMLFYVIANAYIEYKEYGRALGYLKQGLKFVPDDPKLLELAETCMNLRAEAAK